MTPNTALQYLSLVIFGVFVLIEILQVAVEYLEARQRAIVPSHSPVGLVFALCSLGMHWSAETGPIRLAIMACVLLLTYGVLPRILDGVAQKARRGQRDG